MGPNLSQASFRLYSVIAFLGIQFKLSGVNKIDRSLGYQIHLIFTSQQTLSLLNFGTDKNTDFPKSLSGLKFSWISLVFLPSNCGLCEWQCCQRSPRQIDLSVCDRLNSQMTDRHIFIGLHQVSGRNITKIP